MDPEQVLALLRALRQRSETAGPPPSVPPAAQALVQRGAPVDAARNTPRPGGAQGPLDVLRGLFLPRGGLLNNVNRSLGGLLEQIYAPPPPPGTSLLNRVTDATNRVAPLLLTTLGEPVQNVTEGAARTAARRALPALATPEALASEAAVGKAVPAGAESVSDFLARVEAAGPTQVERLSGGATHLTPPAGESTARLFHVTSNEAIAPSSEGTGRIFLSEHTPVGRQGNVFEIDRSKLDPKLLERAPNGTSVIYRGDIPPEAVQRVNRETLKPEPTAASREIRPKATEEGAKDLSNRRGEQAQRVKLRRYTKIPDAPMDPFNDASFTGLGGTESGRAAEAGYQPRIYHYVENAPREDVRGAGVLPHENITSIPRSKLYDQTANPEGLTHPKEFRTVNENHVLDSGYWGYENPERGIATTFVDVRHPAGRFSTNDLSDMVQKIHASQPGGGAGSTVSRHFGDVAHKPFYSVAFDPKEFASLPKRSQYEHFFAAHDKLLEDPQIAAGTWLDRENGTGEASLNFLIRDRNTAIALGKKLNQKAIFDLKNMQEIPTGGTGVTPDIGSDPLGWLHSFVRAYVKDSPRQSGF